jgi:hypothetical protein
MPFPDPAALDGTDAEKLLAFQSVLADMQPKFVALLKE